MLASENVTAHDRSRLVKAAGTEYGEVERAWRVVADERPAVFGLCARVGILLTDDDTIRLAYNRVGVRVAADGAVRVLQSAKTSTSVDFGDDAAAADFDTAWAEPATSTPESRSWRSGLLALSGLLLFLAVVVLVAGIFDAAVLFAHTRKGLVPNGFGGKEDGRVHPQTALAFAVLIGSVASAAVLAWCGVVGNYLLQRLEPTSAETERRTSPDGDART